MAQAIPVSATLQRLAAPIRGVEDIDGYDQELVALASTILSGKSETPARDIMHFIGISQEQQYGGHTDALRRFHAEYNHDGWQYEIGATDLLEVYPGHDRLIYALAKTEDGHDGFPKRFAIWLQTRAAVFDLEVPGIGMLIHGENPHSAAEEFVLRTKMLDQDLSSIRHFLFAMGSPRIDGGSPDLTNQLAIVIRLLLQRADPYQIATALMDFGQRTAE